DRRTLRQREVRAIHHFAVVKIDRLAGFERALLTEAKRHVTRLRGGQRPASRRQILPLEASPRIPSDQTICANLACLRTHLRAPNGRACVRRDDPAANDRGAGNLIAIGAAAPSIRIARGQLASGTAAGLAALAEPAALWAAAGAALRE